MKNKSNAIKNQVLEQECFIWSNIHCKLSLNQSYSQQNTVRGSKKQDKSMKILFWSLRKDKLRVSWPIYDTKTPGCMFSNTEKTEKQDFG